MFIVNLSIVDHFFWFQDTHTTTCGSQTLWKMKVRVGDHYYAADSFKEKKKASQQEAAQKCLKSYGIELTEYLKNQ